MWKEDKCAECKCEAFVFLVDVGEDIRVGEREGGRLLLRNGAPATTSSCASDFRVGRQTRRKKYCQADTLGTPPGPCDFLSPDTKVTTGTPKLQPRSPHTLDSYRLSRRAGLHAAWICLLRRQHWTTLGRYASEVGYKERGDLPPSTSSILLQVRRTNQSPCVLIASLAVT